MDFGSIFLVMKIRQLKHLFLVCLLSGHYPVTAGSGSDSLLWAISGNGLQESSYLFGTIHLLCPGDSPVDERVEKALMAGSRLILEIDITDNELAMKAARLSRNPGNENLRDELDREDKEIVDEFLYQHYGYGLAQLGVLKPLTLLSMVMAKYAACLQPTSVESVIASMAVKQGIPVAALESLEYQMALFDEIPQEFLLRELVNSVRDFERLKQDYIRLQEAYSRRDLQAIVDLLGETENLGRYKSVLLDRRNEEWLPKIETWIHEGPVFIAVGAGHLLSDKGLIQLLREKGYSVEPAGDKDKRGR